MLYMVWPEFLPPDAEKKLNETLGICFFLDQKSMVEKCLGPSRL